MFTSLKPVHLCNVQCAICALTLVFQDYEDFFLSKENNTVFTFLGLRSRPSEKVRDAFHP